MSRPKYRVTVDGGFVMARGTLESVALKMIPLLDNGHRCYVRSNTDLHVHRFENREQVQAFNALGDIIRPDGWSAELLRMIQPQTQGATP